MGIQVNSGLFYCHHLRSTANQLDVPSIIHHHHAN
jgi:hypothetical protein